MCCCKTHIEARNFVAALMLLTKEEKITLPFSNYNEFFFYLYGSCKSQSDNLHVEWMCSPDTKTICADILKRWENLKCMLLETSQNESKVTLMYFQKREITLKSSATLQIARGGNRQMVFPTIDGSSSFQVLIFTPNSNTFRASPYLCSCECCIKQKYGSCPLFEEYELTSMTLIKHAMRSENQQSFQPESKSNEEYDDENLVVNGFFHPTRFVRLLLLYHHEKQVFCTNNRKRLCKRQY